MPVAPHHRQLRPAGALAVAVLAALLLVGAGCSSGSGSDSAGDVFESERTRPTDQSEHDHSGESSALGPETVLPGEIAALGAGAAEGESMELWVGLNICGRFVELPATGAGGPLSLDDAGVLTVAPARGDPSGHDVTVAAVAELLDLDLSTGSLAFGPSWDGRSVGEGEGSMSLGPEPLVTGEECALGPRVEQGEVQLWYYTPAAVSSGVDVRMVVTDPQDTPLVEGGSAVTIAFAPVSSLPTLPPAALVG